MDVPIALYRIDRHQILPIDSETCWAFFSDPQNLARITPPWLDFRVASGVPEEISQGDIISYTIRPFLGIPVEWVTEITQVDRPNSFIDEQRLGPYRFWHHRHLFKEVTGGTEVRDLVHYALPLGPIGGIVHHLFVRRQLQAIFGYRRRVLARRFGESRSVTSAGRSGDRQSSDR